MSRLVLKIKLVTLIALFSLQALAFENAYNRLKEIAKMAERPDNSMDSLGEIEVLGNSSFNDAEIVFLPEVHNDPNSLLYQLLMVAREKKHNSNFVIYDESLTSHKKSRWDFYSQKALEVLVADNHRERNLTYSPRKFETGLTQLTRKIRDDFGALNFNHSQKLWKFSPFKKQAQAFFGWDKSSEGTLLERNLKMIQTLKTSLQENDRIFVMLGARHFPDLEYFTSKQIVCNKNQIRNKDEFFSLLNSKYGSRPKIRLGIGSTLPIYNFLKDKKYIVAFPKSLYRDLNSIMTRQKRFMQPQKCVDL